MEYLLHLFVKLSNGDIFFIYFMFFDESNESILNFVGYDVAKEHFLYDICHVGAF